MYNDPNELIAYRCTPARRLKMAMFSCFSPNFWSQLACTCSKSTVETVEKDVKYVQS